MRLGVGDKHDQEMGPGVGDKNQEGEKMRPKDGINGSRDGDKLDQEKGPVGPGDKDKWDQETRTSLWAGDKWEQETSGTRRGDQNNQEMGTNVTKRGDQDRSPHAL